MPDGQRVDQQNTDPVVRICWTECHSYGEAKDYFESVYVHERDGQAYYVGKLDKTVFGGSQRRIGGKKRSPRYASSYSHWIDGCLDYGARLFIGLFQSSPIYSIADVESELQRLLQPAKDKSKRSTPASFKLSHAGNVPACVKQIPACDGPISS